MESIRLDAIDLRILRILQQDGRITNLELANQVGLTPTPTMERVKRLERAGVIRGYRAMVDRDAVGRGLLVFCSLRLSVHQLREMDAFRERIRSLPAIVSGWNVTGEYDYLLQVAVQDMAQYEAFLRHELSRLPGIERISTSIVLSTVKEHATLPIQPHETDS